MNNKALLIIIIIGSAIPFYAQDKDNRIEFGFAYGLGNEFKNRNYTDTNQYFKLQLYYKIKDRNSFKYLLVPRPEPYFCKTPTLKFVFRCT
jgi:hypothetical protein